MKVTTYSYPPYCPTHKMKEMAVMVTRSGKFKCAKMPSKKWLKAMIKDEHMAHKDYAKHGFPQIAKDEKRHEAIMRKALKRVI